MEVGDYVAITEGVALAGNWWWVLRRKAERDGMRRKLAMYAFGIATASVVLDLILTIILHFHQNPNDAFAGRSYLLLFPSGAVAALIGLMLGVIAKGTPRLAAVIWSLLMLTSSVFTMYFLIVR